MKPNLFRIYNIDSHPFLLQKTPVVPSVGTVIGLEEVSLTIQSSMPQISPDTRIRR